MHGKTCAGKGKRARSAEESPWQSWICPPACTASPPALCRSPELLENVLELDQIPGLCFVGKVILEKTAGAGGPGGLCQWDVNSSRPFITAWAGLAGKGLGMVQGCLGVASAAPELRGIPCSVRSCGEHNLCSVMFLMNLAGVMGRGGMFIIKGE